MSDGGPTIVQSNPKYGGGFNPSALPPGAEAYLAPDNPALVSLQQRYAAFDRTVTAPLVWQPDYIDAAELRHFRGDNGYVWQLRGRNMSRPGYALATYYALARDRLGLLDRLSEDDAFGNFTFEIAGKVVSRDLLDSVNELAFLDRHLGLNGAAPLTVLDIGAGYGRLAHRAVTAFDNVRWLCTDAVPVSTFVSDYYLRFRGVAARAASIPLDQIEQRLVETPADLAINIHSFPECRLEAIRWWLGLIAARGVRRLFLVPNEPHGLLVTNDGADMTPLIAQAGYRLVVREPKYADPFVQESAIIPTHYYLFELS
ncbi:MAG TPA: putative sugar O-methyltransferase [Caulobacteraceae bacterium]|nr:putative sugar O-methyltransferase [Caulobacteraceae bacterium]